MLSLWVYGCLFLLLLGLLWFVSPKLSPIPYFPTLEQDFERIRQALNLKPGSVLFDLGAGDGKMVLRLAAKQVKTVAVESNPYLVAIIYLRRIFHPKKQQISILWQDLFKTNLSKATHLYLFVGPFLIDRIVESILKRPHPNLVTIVSYRYRPKHQGFVKFDKQQYPIYILKLKIKHAHL